MSSPGNRSRDVRSQTQDALFQLLLDKIREDQYPSSTMMDVVEASITEEQLADYAEVLLSKIERDRFPSVPMLKRIATLGS